MECLHRFCRDCIDKSMRLGYGAKHHISFCFLKEMTTYFWNHVTVSILKRGIYSLIMPPGHNWVLFIYNIIMLWLCRNNECPACRTHCASRRSLRDDPNYDALIAALYPDIDKYEEEVMPMSPIIISCLFHWPHLAFPWCPSNIGTSGTCFQWTGEDSE